MALTLAAASDAGGTNTLSAARLYSAGLGASDNDIIVQADDVLLFRQFMLTTSAGAVDVIGSLDGTNYPTAPISMSDLGSASFSTAVVVTAANRIYRFTGCFQKLRVMQNGATPAADVTLVCYL